MPFDMVLKIVLIGVYVLLLAFIFCYSLVQLDLVVQYLKRKKSKEKPLFDSAFTPVVTVQLPVFNERYVVNRLIDAVCNFDYPKDKLEVQVLDDSTDDTRGIIGKKVEEKQRAGFDIKHIYRTDREGFKAGALAAGLKRAKGSFIAVFDADFVPSPGFLKKSIGYFADERIGVVQTPWHHLNHDYSLLTKLQAFGLNAHFSVEQGGRNEAGHFINFNGTAGIWRKTCIEEAGGWSADTLTEDLDLSYRAQLQNWKFVFIEDPGSPAELPANIKALKTQQYRWTKGAAECARKNLGKVLRSNLPLRTKVHATFHLMNSFVFVSVALSSIISVPIMLFKQQFIGMGWLFHLGAVFLLSFMILGVFYWTAASVNKKYMPYHKKGFLWYFPMFLSLSMGLSLHNAIAVIEGYLGRKTPFVRTPKFSIVKRSDSWRGKNYFKGGISALSMIEGVLAVYFLWGCVQAFLISDFGLLPVHFMLAFGFGAIFTYSVTQIKTA